jgi:uncharacterized membrane protein
MSDIESLLNRWQKAGALDADTVTRIRAWEEQQQKPGGLRWQGMVALILGAMLLACGVVLFVSAHWDEIGPAWRYLLVMGMVTLFHLSGAMTRKTFRGLSTALHAVGTVSTGAAIALVGQIFNIEAHWPAAVLLWALAALAGWILLRDEAQQILALLLFPAWMLSEFAFYADGHIGEPVYTGRFLAVWAMLYLTVFLGSKHKIAQGVLFAVAAVGGVVGVGLMLESWRSWGDQTFLSLTTRLCGWILIALLPLMFSIVRPLKSTIPVAAAIVFSVALPWCYRTWTSAMLMGPNRGRQYIETGPNLLAHALVAAFAVFLIWWGVRLASQLLVNLGVVYFAIAVGWFYFSDIYDEMGRSLGLIGLGVLFLAGGWILEKTRRKLLARMGHKDVAIEEAE